MNPRFNLSELIAQDNQENGEDANDVPLEVMALVSGLMKRMAKNMAIAQLCAMVTEKIRSMESVHIDELFLICNKCTCGKCGRKTLPRGAFDELINLGVESGCIHNDNGVLSAVRK
jgi:hypothetical protein